MNFLKKNKIRNRGEGFTLIEMMVAVTIFSLVMMVALSAVLAIVSANKKGEALSSVINNLSFALESMSRDIRTGYNYVGTDGSSITFHSNQFDVDGMKYFFAGNTLMRNKQSGDGDEQMLSDEIYIEEGKFLIMDNDPVSAGDLKQAKVMLIIKGCAGSTKPTSCDNTTNKNISVFNLQTLMTQRRLDL